MRHAQGEKLQKCEQFILEVQEKGQRDVRLLSDRVQAVEMSCLHSVEQIGEANAAHTVLRVVVDEQRDTLGLVSKKVRRQETSPVMLGMVYLGIVLCCSGHVSC